MRPKFLIILLLVLTACQSKNKPFEAVVYHNENVESSILYQKGNMFQKDFLLFAQMMKETHPAFTRQWKAPFDIDSLKKAGYQHLKTCKTKDELAFYIQSLLAPLNDGHTSVNLNMNHDCDTLFFPFQLEYDGTYRIWAIDTLYKDDLGKKVVAINDIPTAKFISGFCRFMSAENEHQLRSNVLEYQLQNHLMYIDSLPYRRKDKKLVLKLEDGQVISLSARNQSTNKLAVYRPQKEINAVNIREKTDLPFLKKIVAEKHIAYLQFNSCDDQVTIRQAVKQQGVKLSAEEKQRLAQYPCFHTFLKDFFREIRDKDIRTLVIDMRDNGGGNSLLCDELLSWLTPIDSMKATTSCIRYSPLLKSYYHKKTTFNMFLSWIMNGGKMDMESLYTGSFRLFKGNHSEKMPNLMKFLYRKYLNFNNDSIFRGNVIIIQNEKTFSSAAIFVQEAYDNGVGRLIGGPSGYNTSGFGDILPWQLPNTNIEGTISHKIFFRPDLTRLQEKTIIPNPVIIPSLDDRASGNDPCWQWIMEQENGS